MMRIDKLQSAKLGWSTGRECGRRQRMEGWRERSLCHPLLEPQNLSIYVYVCEENINEQEALLWNKQEDKHFACSMEQYEKRTSITILKQSKL